MYSSQSLKSIFQPRQPLQHCDSFILSPAEEKLHSLSHFLELQTIRSLIRNKMSGRVSQFLSWLLLATLHLQGTDGFQTNPRSSISVISRSRLSVATNDSVSTTAETTSGNGVDYKAYGNGYKTVFSELPYGSCEPSVGSIPSDLKGSYFRAGPAMFSAGSIAPPKTSIIQPRDGPPIP